MVPLNTLCRFLLGLNTVGGIWNKRTSPTRKFPLSLSELPLSQNVGPQPWRTLLTPRSRQNTRAACHMWTCSCGGGGGRRATRPQPSTRGSKVSCDVCQCGGKWRVHRGVIWRVPAAVQNDSLSRMFPSVQVARVGLFVRSFSSCSRGYTGWKCDRRLSLASTRDATIAMRNEWHHHFSPNCHPCYLLHCRDRADCFNIDPASKYLLTGIKLRCHFR